MDYDDRGLAALPKLVGGPRYTRPPRTGITPVERPASPDDLPLVSERTAEDRALAVELDLDPASQSLDDVPADDVPPGRHVNGSVPGHSAPRGSRLGAMLRGRSGSSGVD